MLLLAALIGAIVLAAEGLRGCCSTSSSCSAPSCSAIGVYGVLARRNGVRVLMSIELILNAVNINLVAFGAMNGDVAGPGLRPVRDHRGRRRGGRRPGDRPAHLPQPAQASTSTRSTS